jgi:hypothetical protein
MKLAPILLVLAHCPPSERPDITPLEGYIIDVCYEREGEAQQSCIDDAKRQALCTGPTEVIADDDPALAFFRIDEGLSLETRKEALAIERVNSCD